jgi:DNA-binding NtrC family response regulator/predicted hydrocarbon binding protein
VNEHKFHLFELLDLRPDSGLILLGNQRMLIESAAALCLHSLDLMRTMGVEKARSVMFRQGYAHGYENGLTLKERFGFKTAAELGPIFHTLQGMSGAKMLVRINDPGGASFHEDGVWVDSLEAEQHLRHRGVSDVPVCWMGIGYVSGYQSAVHAKSIVFREVSCMGMGDPSCRIEGRDTAAWGAELEPYQRDEVSDAALPGLQALRAAIERNHQSSPRPLLPVPALAPAAPSRRSEGAKSSVIVSGNDRFVVRSAELQKAVERARRVAPLKTTVLVLGESGTGKEFFANFIHRQSGRSSEPFISVNCAALPETLLESELFGHVRGSFTGAIRDKPGLFQLARNGTLFLDEVGEMPLAVQAKLLRVLECGEIRKLGGDANIKVNARVIAATNRDLRLACSQGSFRQDLFFRLAGFMIELPALREQREAIPQLAYEFLREMAPNFGKPTATLSPKAVEALLRYDWPGNVRELKHALQHALIVSRGVVIERTDFPAMLLSPDAASSGNSPDLKQIEKNTISRVLRECGGNRTAAAHMLNIGRATLWRKIREYGL